MTKATITRLFIGGGLAIVAGAIVAVFAIGIAMANNVFVMDGPDVVDVTGGALAFSLLGSVMFTYELARRLDGTGVTATVLHPGVVNTAFGAEDPSRIFKVIVPFVRPFMKTPEQGAATSIYLASSSAVEGISGTYFASRRSKTSNERSSDEEAAGRLWRVSAGLVGAESSR